MLFKVFSRDFRSRVFGEFSYLNSKDKQNKIRLNPIDEVAEELRKLKQPMIVLKPLVESQNVTFLLDKLEGAKSIWLFRDYKSVASSNIAKWGKRNGVNNLLPIVRNEADNWRSELVPNRIREQVLRCFHEDMDPHDAAALFWWVRNQFYLDNNLFQHDRVYLCNYENLVLNPMREMQKIYEFLGFSFPGESIVQHIHSKSVIGGKDINLSPEIEALCSNTFSKLLKFAK